MDFRAFEQALRAIRVDKEAEGIWTKYLSFLEERKE